MKASAPDAVRPEALGRQVIERYGAGRFRVAGVDYAGSVLVLARRTLVWPVTQAEGLTPAALSQVIEASASLELLLLGTGPRMSRVPAPLRQALDAVGVKVEAMDTGAACRTFNVLAAEGRRVAAALIAVD